MLSGHRVLGPDRLAHQPRNRHSVTSAFHTFAFSSRYVEEEIPKYALPEKTNEANAVYQLIHDELELDGKPIQNMATFVSSWMEPEAQQLITENIGKNFADKDEYPQSAEIQNRCVNMLARLWNVPEDCHAVGTSSIGSSEAFMLGALAMKFNWRNRMKAAGKPTDKPNIVLGNNAQIALKKFAVYFDVEARFVPVTKESHYVMDPHEAIKYVDENTICVVAILGSTYTGQFENVKLLNELLDNLHKEKGIDVPIHIDAASGGFVAPFAFPQLVWDFRLPRVKSINASGHKYGLVYPGVGWVVWRNTTDLPEDLVLRLDYLGGDSLTFTLNFSRSAVHVISQYFNFLRLGREGYTKVMTGCIANAKYLSKALEESGHFEILSDIHRKGTAAVPLVSFALKPSAVRPTQDQIKAAGHNEFVLFDEYDLMRTLQRFGWTVPAYKLPPNCDKKAILRVVVREIHARDLMHLLVKDILRAVEFLQQPKQLILLKEPHKKLPRRKEKKQHTKEKPLKGRKSSTYSSVC